jgi:dTDP-4-dehydrorhamnose 3,5-epimerase
MQPPPLLPSDVQLVDLTPHADIRGIFTEIFRDKWSTGFFPSQWNAVHSNTNVLRGFHVHWQHTDYLLVASGTLVLGLKDLRQTSSTFGLSARLSFSHRSPQAIIIPPGVGHAFYFPEPSIHIYAVSHDWNTDDELGCRWDDPGLELDWPFTSPLISPHDEKLPSLSALTATLNERLAQTSK